MRRSLLSLLLLATLLACERREPSIVTHQEVQKTPQLAAKPLTVDEAVATATQFASDLLGQDARSSGITPLLSPRTRGDNGERDTMLLAVHLAGGGLTFVDPRLEAQDAVLCVLPDTDSVEDVPPPAQFFIQAICERIPAWRIDPNGDGPIDWHPTPPPPTGGGGGGSSGSPDSDHISPDEPLEYDVVTHNILCYEGPFLTTKWTQSDGFNKYCVVNGVTCKVGCLPLAIGQVLAFHRIPSYIPWDGVLSASKPTGAYMDHVARLLFQIGQTAKASYGISATSTPIANIVPTLKAYGISSYDAGQNSNAAIQDLENRKPVIISGFTDVNFSGGHTWVLDGIKITSICRKRYSGSGALISEKWYESCLVHANMGWGGTGDGWYKVTDYNVQNVAHFSYNFHYVTEITR